jgi:hypothetical protein
MRVDRIHSSESEVFIKNQRLTGVQSFSINETKDFAEIQDLGSYSVTNRILNPNQKINVSLDFILIDNNSPINANRFVCDPFYQFQTSGLLSTETFNLSFKNFAGENIVSGAYLTSYSINGSLDNFVVGSVEYEANDISYNTGGRLTRNNLNNDIACAFRPHRIMVSGNFGESISNNNFNIQSFELKVPIKRKAITILGNASSQFRYPELPINGTLNFSVMKNQITGIDLSSIILNKGSFTINLNQNLSNPILRYIVSGCSLTSISENSQLDDNATIDFNYEFSLNKNSISRILMPST